MRFLILLAILGGSACDEAQSERCRSVCQKEAVCAESRQDPEESIPYDYDECVAACVALERDTASKLLVDKHVACADEAGDSCEALMKCR